MSNKHNPLQKLLNWQYMVWRGLKQHALSTAITVGSVALASGLLLSVFSIQAQSRAAFTSGASDFDAVLGARGSQLQLVLNTVFHLETSPGNIPWSMYQSVKQDSRVRQAVPYALGDNYYGYRIVGTTKDLFEGRYALESGSQLFSPDAKEAIVGSFAAQKTGLKLGDTFNPYHGLSFRENMRHAETYRVVGLLKPTNTPVDRVIWIPIEGVFRMGGHVLRGTGQAYKPQAEQEIPDEHKEVSAVMLKLSNPQAGIFLDHMVNKQGKVATLAWPIGRVMAELFEKMGWMHRVLKLIAYLVLIIVGAGILSSIYNSIEQRRREFAIMRAMGARKGLVFALIVGESTAIAQLGAVLGFGVYFAILAVVAAVIRSQTGVVLDLLYWHSILWIGPLIVMFIGALAGLLPAWKAYRTDVASHLVPTT